MALNPPLGTSDPQSFMGNVQRLDKLINGPDDTVIDRGGVPRKSWAKIENGFDAIVSSLDGEAIIKETIEQGLAETTEGQYFRIPDGDAFTFYRNEGGVAVEVAKLIGTDYVDSRMVPGLYRPTKVPLFHDTDENVPLWLDKGALDAAAMGPVLQEFVSQIPNKFLPQLSLSTRFFPILYDNEGNVPFWLDKGLPDAAGLGPVLQQFIKNLVNSSGGGSSIADSYFIQGDLYKFLFKRGMVSRNEIASLNVAFTGDSWTENNTIPQSLIDVLGGSYKDQGWIDFSYYGGPMAGVPTVGVTGFTLYDGGKAAINPPLYGSGPDGYACYNNNVVGTIRWSNIKATDISLFYYDGNGSFTVTIGSNDPVTITGNNTGKSVKYDFTGLNPDAGVDFTIHSSGDGVVSIFGLYSRNNSIQSGITVSRMGNQGAIASDYLNFSDWIEPVVKYLDIDMLFIILGTNDFRLNQGVAQYKTGISEIISKHRSANPGVCICLISPAQSNPSGNPALSEYDVAMRQIAIAENVSFISGYQLFPKQYDNSNGAWQDTLHLSNKGAYVLTQTIKNKFFQE